MVIEDGCVGEGVENLRKEVLEEAGKGKHWLSGVFSNKAKKKGVFSVSRAGFRCIYNRGSVGG